MTTLSPKWLLYFVLLGATILSGPSLASEFEESDVAHFFANRAQPLLDSFLKVPGTVTLTVSSPAHDEHGRSLGKGSLGFAFLMLIEGGESKVIEIGHTDRDALKKVIEQEFQNPYPLESRLADLIFGTVRPNLFKIFKLAPELAAPHSLDILDQTKNFMPPRHETNIEKYEGDPASNSSPRLSQAQWRLDLYQEAVDMTLNNRGSSDEFRVGPYSMTGTETGYVDKVLLFSKRTGQDLLFTFSIDKNAIEHENLYLMNERFRNEAIKVLLLKLILLCPKATGWLGVYPTSYTFGDDIRLPFFQAEWLFFRDREKDFWDECSRFFVP